MRMVLICPVQFFLAPFRYRHNQEQPNCRLTRCNLSSTCKIIQEPQLGNKQLTSVIDKNHCTNDKPNTTLTSLNDEIRYGHHTVLRCTKPAGAGNPKNTDQFSRYSALTRSRLGSLTKQINQHIKGSWKDANYEELFRVWNDRLEQVTKVYTHTIIGINKPTDNTRRFLLCTQFEHIILIPTIVEVMSLDVQS